ncbi:MAG: hypothetical protein ABI867_24650 [Kofleriaceae bacterium]
MAVVSIEQDATYRRDGDRFLEICKSCRRDRTADTCECGAVFERMTSGRTALQWTPTAIVPEMPPLCPHCDRRPSRLRSITMKTPIALGKQGGSSMTLEFESCQKMLPPFLAYLLVVVAGFFAVVFGLMVVSGMVVAIIPLVVAIAAGVAAWRAYGWIRFARYDARSIRLRVRRPVYAFALAEKNHGRVII